jgi:hypothetical protein
MATSMLTIKSNICKIVADHAISKDDLEKVSKSETEKNRFINTYIQTVSPAVQQYLDTAAAGKFKARNFTTTMLEVVRYKLEKILEAPV